MLTADHKRQRVEAAQEFLAFTEQPKRNFWTLLLLVTRPGYTTPHRNKGAIEAVETPFCRQEQRSSNKSCLPGKSWLAFFGIERAYCCASLCLAGQQSMLTGTVRP
ncbi:hypothetical protein TNCV_3304421 [Trichonephila clavipes]|nr:hypothetical protein TNCV_3304421 [Trichonephila clavipes]